MQNKPHFSLTNMGFPSWGEGVPDLGTIPTFSLFFLLTSLKVAEVLEVLPLWTAFSKESGGTEESESVSGMYMLHWAVYVGTWQLGVGSAKSEVVAVLIWRRPAIDALLFLLANDKFVQPIPRKTFFRNHETIVTAIAGSLNVMEWPLALLFPIRGGFGIYMHPKSWHCQKGGTLPLARIFLEDLSTLH